MNQERACRVCLTNSVMLLNIFNDPEQLKRQEEHLPTLMDMLNEFCETRPDDPLPGHICLSCALAAENAFRFKRRYEESQRHFYELMTTMSIPSEAQSDIHYPAQETHIDVSCVKIETEEQQQPEDPLLEPLPSQSTMGFHCPYCPQMFTLNHNLKAHIRIHTGVRPFKCSECGQSFTQNGHLTKHLRWHTGEKPYSCPHCSMSFSQSQHLQRHIRTHTGERPYKCPHCPSAFLASENLKTHIRIHTGEKPFKCNYCNKAFADNNNLKKHRRRHTGERPFNCPHCNKDFKERHHLKAHVSVIHRDIQEQPLESLPNAQQLLECEYSIDLL